MPRNVVNIYYSFRCMPANQVILLQALGQLQALAYSIRWHESPARSLSVCATCERAPKRVSGSAKLQEDPGADKGQGRFRLLRYASAEDQAGTAAMLKIMTFSWVRAKMYGSFGLFLSWWWYVSETSGERSHEMEEQLSRNSRSFYARGNSKAADLSSMRLGSALVVCQHASFRISNRCRKRLSSSVSVNQNSPERIL